MTRNGETSGRPARKFRVTGMDCGNCALTIEDSLQKQPGVEQITVSFTTETMELRGDAPDSVVERRLAELGYGIAPMQDPEAAEDFMPRRGLRGFARFLAEQPGLRPGLVATALVALGLAFLRDAPAIAGLETLELVFAAAVLIAGAPVFSRGLRAAIYARRITIDLLMAVACAGALAIGETGEAVTVILLFTLGEALEAYSASRARDSLRSLMALQPQEATVLRGPAGEEPGQNRAAPDRESSTEDRHDHQRVVPIDEVRIGDRVLVRPGQRIPVDGEILRGHSSVNQAPVTGESVPVPKREGDEVMAGTVNGEAALQIRVTRVAADGTIARIARLVEEAQARRSPQERFIDRFAHWYTPAVVALAALVAAVPVLFFGQPLVVADAPTEGWLYRGLALLIVACPCALVISIPVTVVSGLTRLARLGVLVKGGAQLDRLADVRVVAFDKTGTLTHGRPVVTGLQTASCEHTAGDSEHCAPCDAVVASAAAVERASEHPVAHAIVEAADRRRLLQRLPAATQVVAHPGRGVSGTLRNGARIAVGSDALVGSADRESAGLSARAAAARRAGQTVMYVYENERLIGYIGVQDRIRESAADVLRALEALHPPVRSLMLTGDNAEAAARIADAAGGVDEVRASLLPADKLEVIEEARQRLGVIAMVGEGINDAPALARADVGIAMGGTGTAQAMETADIVLMQDDLGKLPLCFRMARKARRLIKENIALSLGLKLAFLGLAAGGLATLWMAVLADVGATLLVTLNGMRLLRLS